MYKQVDQHRQRRQAVAQHRDAGHRQQLHALLRIADHLGDGFAGIHRGVGPRVGPQQGIEQGAPDVEHGAADGPVQQVLPEKVEDPAQRKQRDQEGRHPPQRETLALAEVVVQRHLQHLGDQRFGRGRQRIGDDGRDQPPLVRLDELQHAARCRLQRNLAHSTQCSATQAAGWMWRQRRLRRPARASGGLTSPWKITMRVPGGTAGARQ
jgi:hypothetical protein